MHSRTAAILFYIAALPASTISWQLEREQAARQHTAGNYREAEGLLQDALQHLQQTAPGDPHVPEILNDLGAECHLMGKYDEAERLYQAALNTRRHTPQPPADGVARTLANLATTRRTRGNFQAAEAAYREALQSLEGNERYAAQYAFTLSNLADLYRL